jgi:ankyrin repeat protein
VNAQAKNGATALYQAAIEGQADAVKVLLDAKADPSLKDTKGRSPLDVALAKNRTEVVKILKDAGVNR